MGQLVNLILEAGSCTQSCLGVFRTFPVEGLYVDAHEACLGARRA